MKDPKKDLVAEFYRDFDEMSFAEVNEYIDRILGWTTQEEDEDHTLDLLRDLAWEGYAENLGLDYHSGEPGELMQFGDGGYPYLYTVPADGGDTLCFKCATKALKKGETVGWMHHMEGDVEYCAECSAEVKPFHEDESEPLPVEKAAVHLGIDWGNGKSFTGLTVICDGKIVGTVTSISAPKIDYGPDVIVEKIDATKYAVPRGQTYEASISKMLVNWPLMAELKRREIDEFLAGREPPELSAEEVIQLLALVTAYEDLKKRPDEFEGEEQS